MNSPISEDSFLKGKQFEDFVQNVLFPQSLYELLYRTPPYQQNSQRFVTSTVQPDFQLKSLVDGKVFYVEAKYRSKTYQDQYDLLSDGQMESFPALAKETPIYIALGYGGEAHDPEFVALIPFFEGMEQRMSPEELAPYCIPKEAFMTSQLPKPVQAYEVQEPTRVAYEAPQETVPETPKHPSKNRKPLYAVLGIILLGMIGFTAYSFDWGKSPEVVHPKEVLKKKVLSYYQLANSYKFDSLLPFYHSSVKWYGAPMAPRRIIASVKEHHERYPIIESLVEPNTIHAMETEGGDYYVSYEMIYRFKKTQADRFQEYPLKMITYWSKDFKLKQVSEVRK